MPVKPRPSSRQVTLFPDSASNEETKVEDVRPELIAALADLLLEALGEERDEEGQGHDSESEDHS